MEPESESWRILAHLYEGQRMDGYGHTTHSVPDLRNYCNTMYLLVLSINSITTNSYNTSLLKPLGALL
eukprot:3454015-Rhodomonas_salina.2